MINNTIYNLIHTNTSIWRDFKSRWTTTSMTAIEIDAIGKGAVTISIIDLAFINIYHNKLKKKKKKPLNMTYQDNQKGQYQRSQEDKQCMHCFHFAISCSLWENDILHCQIHKDPLEQRVKLL